MNKTNIKDLELARDYLDKLIDEAYDQIAELDQKIAENKKLINDCINAREVLNHLESKDKEGNENA